MGGKQSVDKDFDALIDRVYQVFSKTSYCENRSWDYGFEDEGRDPLNVYAVDDDGEFTFIGAFANDADADFVSLAHAAIPELVRGAREALDEAERADRQKDERECRIAELELEVAALRKELLTA
jgi:hypothetical protein